MTSSALTQSSQRSHNCLEPLHSLEDQALPRTLLSRETVSRKLWLERRLGKKRFTNLTKTTRSPCSFYSVNTFQIYNSCLWSVEWTSPDRWWSCCRADPRSQSKTRCDRTFLSFIPFEMFPALNKQPSASFYKFLSVVISCIQDTHNGMYSVIWKPAIEGLHTIAVTVKESHIRVRWHSHQVEVWWCL